MFLFAVWSFCVMLNFNTNDYHHIGKKELLKVIHGNSNSSENFSRLTLAYHPQKTFLNKMYLFSNFFDELLTTLHHIYHYLNVRQSDSVFYSCFTYPDI